MVCDDFAITVADCIEALFGQSGTVRYVSAQHIVDCTGRKYTALL